MQTVVELERLRRRLTVLYTATAAVGLVVLAAITTTVEAGLRADRVDQELIGWASRAASLVDDSTGTLDPGAIGDDVIHERVEWLAFGTGPGDSLSELGGSRPLDGAAALAGLAALDDEERGTVGAVTVDGVRRRAAAMPLFVDDDVRGAVVVAALPSTEGSTFARAVWSAAASMVVFGALAGWWLAGRSIRPAAASIEHHEQFLAAAAHELRAPLARVRAVGDSVRLLAGDLGHDEELALELDRLSALTTESTLAVEQLLLMARVDAGSVVVRHEPVRLDLLASELARQRRGIAVDAQPGLAVDGDRTLLAVAVGNLLANAERHGPGDSVEPQVALTVLEHDGEIVITVSDSGPGFDPAELSHVFERFRTTAPGGTGLGLWLVRWVAQAHGGDAVAANRPEGGAAVEIRLPRRADSSGGGPGERR